MKCSSCGADFASDQLRCPYCSAVNEHALKLAKELQQYDKKYEESRDEMLRTGENKVLKKLTIGMGVAFLIISVVFGATLAIYNYNFAPNAKSNVVGKKYEHNKAMLKKYMDEKKYIRAYVLASSTDPTTEYFKYYPEYKDELTAIYSYYLIFTEIRQSMESMDEGDNYRAFEPTQAISIGIFYDAPDSEVKKELEKEIDGYLKNYYQLTEDEITMLKEIDNTSDFTLDGDKDIAKVSKERMVNYFGK